MGASWCRMGPLGRLFGPSWGPPGRSWGGLGAIFGAAWGASLTASLGCFSGLPEMQSEMRLLGASWGPLGASWGPLWCLLGLVGGGPKMHIIICIFSLRCWASLGVPWGPTGGALGLWLRFFLLGGENEGMAPEHPSILMDAGALPGAEHSTAHSSKTKKPPVHKDTRARYEKS